VEAVEDVGPGRGGVPQRLPAGEHLVRDVGGVGPARGVVVAEPEPGVAELRSVGPEPDEVPHAAGDVHGQADAQPERAPAVRCARPAGAVPRGPPARRARSGPAARARTSASELSSAEPALLGRRRAGSGRPTGRAGGESQTAPPGSSRKAAPPRRPPRSRAPSARPTASLEPPTGCP